MVAAQLKTQDDPRLVGLRNRMEDTDDWAAADAMAAMDISLVSRDLAVLAEVEGALGRLADGCYGECVDCGVDYSVRAAGGVPCGDPLRRVPVASEAREQAALPPARQVLRGTQDDDALARVADQPREELEVPEPRVLRLQDPVVLVGEVDEARGDALAPSACRSTAAPASPARGSRARRG